MENKCPHCGSENCIPEIAKTNCLLFGKGFFDILCRTCGKSVYVVMERVVQINSIEVGYKDKDDFGYNPNFKLPE